MTARFFTCKQSAGSSTCGVKFHEDEKEEFIEHLAAHGVDTSALARMPWWDEEGAYSLSPADRVQAHTPIQRNEVGDGSDTQVRENARKWHDLKALEESSAHDTPASAFIGAHVVTEAEKRKSEKAKKPIAHAEVACVKPPTVGLPPEVGLTHSPALADGGIDPAGVQQDKSKSRIEKKENRTMATIAVAQEKKQEPDLFDNALDNAPVVNLTAGSGTGGAPRVCMTTGRGFTDVKAIKAILEIYQAHDPRTVIVNQGRWEGDKIVASIARNIGLSYEEVLPKFILARRRGLPLFSEDHRMTPEENAKVGYGEIQTRMAKTCDELDVFGTPSGPQLGLMEAFNEVDKKCRQWGASTD